MLPKKPRAPLTCLIIIKKRNYFFVKEISFINYFNFTILFYLFSIADMETELNAHKEKYNNLHEDVRRLKGDISYKNDEIDQLHKRVTRVTTVKKLFVLKLIL